jgi:protein TonB
MAIGSMRDGSMKELGDMKTQLGKIEFELSEVDSPPQAIRKAPAVYPFSAKRQGLTGKVMIRCLVNVDGTASKHQIVESEPKGVFDEAALEALEKWRFKPGVLGGERVSTWVRVPFVFELN